MESPTEPSGNLPPECGLLPGAAFGPFQLASQLGSGATGSVWRARMAEPIPGVPVGSIVAVKVLHAHLLEDPDAHARFAREGRLAAALRHPCVVSTLGTGTVERDGRAMPWLAMELVQGQTLRDLMRTLGRVPEPLLRDLARQMAEGLAAIHAAGIIHRDLKPGNIIITPDHGVRLMDLGIAVDLRDEARLTQTGMFVGTLLYASPEQFGRAALTPASDLYSLGALLYEAATGAQPFEAADMRAVIRRHLEHVPAPVGSVDPAITPFFEELVAALLAKKPGDRPGPASVLAGVLERGEDSDWWRERERALRAANPSGEIRRAHAAPATPLIGREAELATLIETASAAAAGRGCAVLVEGEAGVGKSRLLAAFEDEARARGDIVVLRSSHGPGDMGLGHDGIGRALVEHFGPEEFRRLAHEHLSHTPRLALGLLHHATGEPLSPAEAPLSPEALATAFVTLVRGMAARRALVFLIEDLHFASAESRLLALSLARMAPDHGASVIVTSRPQGATELDVLGALPGARRIALRRLSAAEVVRLVACLLGSESAAERIGGKVARRTDGNPFFIVEMLREMKERGFVRQDADGSWRATGEVRAFDIPSSVRGFLQGRLRDLKDDDRALLDAAAVAGHHFDPDLVARALDRRRLDTLQALAAIARRTGLIEPTGSGFQFEHHQMHEIVYDAIPPILRSEYHGLIAEAWRERAGEAARDLEGLAGEDACWLAGHLLRGGRGADGARLAPRAAAWLAARGDVEAAVALGELALVSASPDDDALRHQLAVIVAGSLALLGRRARERELVDVALTAARRLGDPAREAAALRALGSHLLAKADYDGALEHLERALELAVTAGDATVRARVLGALAATLFRLGDYARARATNVAFVEASRGIGDAVGEAQGLGQLGNVLLRLGHHDEALAMFEESARLAGEHGRRRTQGLSLAQCGMVHLSRARYARARACFLQAGTIARELGLAMGDADESLGLSHVAAAQGELPEARARALHSLATFRDAGNAPGEAAALDAIAVVDLAEGRLEDCDERIERCFEIGTAIGSRIATGFASLLRSQVEDMRGNAARARSLMSETLGTAEQLGDAALLAHARLEQLRQLLERGQLEMARQALGQASDLEPAWLVEILRAEAAGNAAAVPPGAAIPADGGLWHRVLAHASLWRQTGEAAHAFAAHGLVAMALEHLSGEDRERAEKQGLLARSCPPQSGG